MEDSMEIPNLFIESYWVNGDENVGGGAAYVKLMEWSDTALIGEFGMVEEAGFITRCDDEWVFEAGEKDNIDHPPFRRIYEADKDDIRRTLQSGKYFYGEAIAEAWDNWSEGDGFRLRIDGDEREFEADHQRLMKYDRGY